MSNVTLDPYLYFAGDCKQAMEFYKTVFGGELVSQTYEEGPGTDDPSRKGLIIHARLEGGDIKLMASDTPSKDIGKGNIELALGGDDEAKLTGIFDKLSAGGKVSMPMEKQFWGDIYGKLTDKYSIDWAINVTTDMPGTAPKPS